MAARASGPAACCCCAVAVEITYGLERIIMALQGVEHFKDIRYTDGGITYGELFLQVTCAQNESQSQKGRKRMLGTRANRRRDESICSEREPIVGNEYEMSCFNMDEADVEAHRTRFDLFDAEAKRMLEKRLP
eukprot:7933656-Pyramimonas_sp.AAC.1